MRKVTPLAGQVLVELDPPDVRSASGIEFTRRPLSPEEVQERAINPDKPPGLTGKVIACGAWPKLANGMCLMPEFGIGARVVILPRRGTDLQWDTTRRFKMVRQQDILAIVSV